MSSTKNTKDNRQVVKATFCPPESVFEIPDGIDLEDETIVKWWEVKYNMLCIYYVNGEEIQISPVLNGFDSDFKCPMDCEIISAKDADYEYEEDEEDEEDEQEETSDYMKELITCSKCKKVVKRKDLYWKEGGAYTDVCEKC